MTALRRPAADIRPRSARYAGQYSVMILRKSIVSCQCAENFSSTNPASPSRLLSSVSIMSMSEASSAASAAACAGVLLPVTAATRVRAAAHRLRPAQDEARQRQAPFEIAHGRRDAMT